MNHKSRLCGARLQPAGFAGASETGGQARYRFITWSVSRYSLQCGIAGVNVFIVLLAGISCLRRGGCCYSVDDCKTING